METLPDRVLSVVFSNLAKAAEKQKLTAESLRFARIGEEFWTVENTGSDFKDYTKALTNDVESTYPSIQETVSNPDIGDAGAQRCIKWAEKVTAIQKSLLSRYSAKGEDLLVGKGIYICEACGFISLGTDKPELCPVCKAPPSRFSRVS